METDRPHREVCITGVRTIDELLVVNDVFLRLRTQICGEIEVKPILAIGVLASSSTLRGQTNRWPKRYPSPEWLREFFEVCLLGNIKVRLHLNVGDPTTLVEEVELAHQVCGAGLISIQLNMCWPWERLLTEIRQRHPGTELLLQIGGNALLEFEASHGGAHPFYDIDGLSDRLATYTPLISRVLLDPSGGRGQLLNVGQLLPIVEELSERFPYLGIGVAGGLCAETLPSIVPLVVACPTLSIDAEGRLRNPDTDELDMDRVEAYLKAAFDLFCSH